jgi:glucokinase
MISLAADIGGTYSRFAWFGEHDSALPTEQVFANADFDSLEAVIDHGRASLGKTGEPVGTMVLALPGPVAQDPVQLTNIDWRIQRNTLNRRFGVRRLTLINDFQAAALGAVNEPFELLKVLNPAPPDDAPVVVTGAGTGLGMAWFARRSQPALPQATEGGHLDFAPTNAEQATLHQALARRYGHVSYERILSGPGLVETYRHFAGDAAQAETPAQVTALAHSGDDHAAATVRCFVAVFAAYAGNLALAFNCAGGLYLCGGLTAHLADWFDPEGFTTVFTDKGRMSTVARRIPVYLVTRADTGLAGALQVARSGRVSPWA